MFIRNSAEVFIYFSSSHTRLLFEVGAFSIKCSKTLYFLKERRGAIACLNVMEHFKQLQSR